MAQCFDYSPGAFRVLCHQFRHDPGKRAAFFPPPPRASQQHPARARVRERAVALRKRNFSVNDIQGELAAAGHTVSINTLSLLLRQEGFARLPRRRDDERPATVGAEPAAVADVRVLSLAPRAFRTRLGGLLLFVPLMRDIRLNEVVRQAQLPTSSLVPAEQAVRTLLARKLALSERTSPVMNLVSDEGIALKAGLAVVPKRSYLAAYSSRCDDRVKSRLMAAWFSQVEGAGRKRGDSLDLDFHSVPANTTAEPLEKHDGSRRSRSQHGILTFLARDASPSVLCYAHAGSANKDQADEILRCVDFWLGQTGVLPKELVFDSRLTTYAQLQRRGQKRIHKITLRRRSRKMLAAMGSRPLSAWRRITLPALTRTFRTPKVEGEGVHLRGYAGELRQVTIIDLGHEEPTILLSNDFKLGCPALVSRYAQRLLIENGISAAVPFFHVDALTSMVGLKVDFDLQITVMASALYRLLAQKIGGIYASAHAKKIFHNLLDVSASVAIANDCVVATLDKRGHNPFLVQSRLADAPTPMPWFGNKPLHIRFA